MKFKLSHPEMPDFLVRLPDGKILFKRGTDPYHYTLHPGYRSGLVDIHQTFEHLRPGDEQKHKTLATVPRTALLDALHGLPAELMSEFMALWRPVRLGWLNRRRIGIGPRLPTSDEIQSIDKISIKKDQFACSADFAKLFEPPEFYEDVLRHPGTGYLLFVCKGASQNPIGAMFSYLDQSGNVRLRWSPIQGICRWARKWERYFLTAGEQLLQRTGT